MRYVIVSVVKGNAGDFNNNLRKEIYEKFKAKSSKLPAHFTIKAPFEYDGDISELQSIIKNLCNIGNKPVYTINGYNHFDNRVIYMDLHMSKEGEIFHNKIVDELSKLSYINFTKSDGKNKVFHVTLASKRIQDIYYEIWSYVNKIPCNFNCEFDNICIYAWDNNKWNLVHEYIIK